ncbi:hypothetical protein BC941DRAFT_414983 [Chlamydoabsidia padenii]|nr:hypothetical protein BC941DRAFT_414983 [Chlamydoabsidia padenii]
MTLPTSTHSSLVDPTSTVTTDSSSVIPQKRSYVDDKPLMLNKKQQLGRRTTRHCGNHTQACLLLHAIEINQRRSLNPRCVAYLANYVAQSWEINPDEAKVRQLYQLMQNLLSTTAINEPNLEQALISFCQNKASTPTPCPNVTLLIAIGYIQRLNKKYDSIKGTVGCGSRLITIAYLMAAKYLQSNLRLIIRSQPSTTRTKTEETFVPSPVSPPTSPSMATAPNQTPPAAITPTTPPLTPFASLSSQPSDTLLSSTNERYLRIMRLELEFLRFLDYDLSTRDPATLICWAHSFDTSLNDNVSDDEADDEMDDDDDE